MGLPSCFVVVLLVLSPGWTVLTRQLTIKVAIVFSITDTIILYEKWSEDALALEFLDKQG